MSAVFADTSYYVAFLNPRDENHQAAVSRTAGLRGPIVTTVWVLIELANFLARGPNRSLFVSFLSTLRADPDVRIISHEGPIFEAGLDLYSQRSDKDWSLTDCLSFVVMRRQGLTEALTTDHHFQQAGLRALLIEAP